MFGFLVGHSLGEKISRGDILRYIALPQIMPRMKELFGSGLHYIPFFIALVYQAVRLLPAGHPYTDASNMGTFGIRHVVAQAANHLVLSRKNIDQILLFFVSLVGLVILFVQMALLLFAFIFEPAVAQMPESFGGFFSTPTPAHDLAFMMMDMVFGVPDLFNSCVSTATACKDVAGNALSLPEMYADNRFIGPLAPGADQYFPFAVHVGLHQMFQFYSIGLLVVASFITTYFIFAVLAETAQTGTAFGKRFNRVWAPIRIVVAFGLLVPVGYGINSAQYIVLYAAKFGSSFATNGWILFNETLSEKYTEGMGNLVSTPNIPEVGALLQFFDVARTCYEVEKTLGREIKPYLVRGPLDIPNHYEIGFENYQVVLSLEGKKMMDSYETMVAFANGGNKVTVRFGHRYDEQDPKADKTYYIEKGYVKPVCGEITFNLIDARIPDASQTAKAGTEILQRYYWYLLAELWYREGPVISNDNNYPCIIAQGKFSDSDKECYGESIDPEKFSEYRRNLGDFYREDLLNVLEDPVATGLSEKVLLSEEGAIEAQQNADAWGVSQDLLDKGWVGAAIWYNRIAEMNGAITTAVLNVPEPGLYPDVMEDVLKRKKQNDEGFSFEDRFNPQLAGVGSIKVDGDTAKKAVTYYEAFKYWQDDGLMSSSHITQTNNILIDAANAVFGTEGLFSMRENADVHPLAQLVGIGRSLIESSVRNLGAAVAVGGGGAVMSTLHQLFALTGGAAASFLISFAMVGLTVGFVMFYIVPFLPFIYFFFAAAGWIKGIFEAMVGVPLWALAHIRIDGEGLAGSGAGNGYFLIFEIFLRPLLTLFGFLASILTFSAMVSVLNQIFDLVTSNLTGFNVVEAKGPLDIATYRDPVDQIFFTIVYAIIVYLMGMSSFKLVDLVPNQILRWMGQSVVSFNDERGDPAQSLVSTSTIGAQQITSKLGGGLGKAAELIKKMG